MLYKKSFDLNKDESQTRNSEKLYQPKQFCCCKYIVIPLLIGFILLLILINVDFKGDAYKQTSLETDENDMSKDSITISGSSLEKSTLTAATLQCINSSNGCSVTCQDGTVNNIYQILEPLYQICRSDMVLILRNCSFPSGELTSDFFQGNFRLTELNIINCNMKSIADKSFLQDSVKNLKSFYLIGSQFEKLQQTAFEGLEQLDYYHMVNLPVTGTSFKGYELLKYFSQTLTGLFLQQQTTEDVAYDPYNWLKGSPMISLLRVDLSNNNFQNLLNEQTFSTLVAITELYLSNCYISYLPSNVFVVILQTLQLLDLSDNYLTTLPPEILLNKKELNLNLNYNYWDCTCENKEMLTIIQNNIGNVQYLERENLKCYTPLDVKEVEIDNLTLGCLRETTYVMDTTDSSCETERAALTTTSSKSEATETTEMETIDTSGETSQPYETSTTTAESTSKSTTTTMYSTTKSSPITEATTTKRTTVTIPSYQPTATTMPTTPFNPFFIECTDSSDTPQIYRHVLRKEKCIFAIYSITKTSVKIVLPLFLPNIEVFYFTNSTQSTTSLQEITPWTRQQFIYSILITDLDPQSLYVFCLVEAKQMKLSPFDCKGFAMPEDMPQAWILNDDQTWILCLVVLGICLMLLLGIVVTIIVYRFEKRRKNRRLNKNSAVQISLTNHNVSSLALQNLQTSQIPSTGLHQSQHLSPDVTAPQVNYNIDNDLCFYEDIIM